MNLNKSFSNFLKFFLYALIPMFVLEYSIHGSLSNNSMSEVSLKETAGTSIVLEDNIVDQSEQYEYDTRNGFNVTFSQRSDNDWIANVENRFFEYAPRTSFEVVEKNYTVKNLAQISNDYVKHRIHVIPKKKIVYLGIIGLRGGGVNISYEKESSKSHFIKSYHVSCRSDKFDGKSNYGGVVLYLYKEKLDWYLNSVHCKIGYIIFKKTDGLVKKMKEKHGKYPAGQIHGAVYMSVFGTDLDRDKVVATGFSFHEGDWKYNSRSCHNEESGFHGSCSQMGPIESKCVRQAVENWKRTGKQNTDVGLYLNKY